MGAAVSNYTSTVDYVTKLSWLLAPAVTLDSSAMISTGACRVGPSRLGGSRFTSTGSSITTWNSARLGLKHVEG